MQILSLQHISELSIRIQNKQGVNSSPGLVCWECWAVKLNNSFIFCTLSSYVTHLLILNIHIWLLILSNQN